MKVKLNSISGIDDAICTMFISKHNWTESLDNEIRAVVNEVVCTNGSLLECYKNDSGQAVDDSSAYDKYNKWMTTLCKWGCRHITMLKFIDLSVSVRGLHRAGQDDWDAHAKRFDNRIVRNSSRFAGIKDESHLQNLSEFYADKVLTTDAALQLLQHELPQEIEYNGEIYVRAFNGYIRKGLEDNQDVKRGLYNLGFPSDFLFKCNLAEFAHVYQERGKHGNANPEVKRCAELIADALAVFQPAFNREFLMQVKN